MTSEELARVCGVHAPSLFRMLRFLSSIEIFHQNEAGQFQNTPASEVLREGVTGSLRPMVRLAWQDVIWDTYKAMPEAIKNGTPAFAIAHGRPFFDHLSAKPDIGALFDASMALMSGPENATIAETYPLGNAMQIVDIGGGRGGLLAAILKKHEHLNGILFDQEQVIAEPALITEADVQDRCKLVNGNFFETVPAGGDVYLLKRILHDWSDEDALRILKCVGAALTSRSRIAVIDAVIKPGNNADPNKYLDVGIMTLLEGRERTAEDFEVLFSKAGLQVLRILPTPASSAMSIIEGAIT
jgi:hypothetical protein